MIPGLWHIVVKAADELAGQGKLIVLADSSPRSL